MSYIDFYTLDKDGPEGVERKWLNQACFASASWDDEKLAPFAIRYPCVNTATKQSAQFWCIALSMILDDSLFVYHADSDKWTNVEFTLKSEGMEYKKALLYLTAFRYLYEGPRFVEAYQSLPWKEEPTKQELFDGLMDLALGAGKLGGPMSGHALFSYYYDDKIKRITYDKFLKNLADPSFTTVQMHFSK